MMYYNVVNTNNVNDGTAQKTTNITDYYISIPVGNPKDNVLIKMAYRLFKYM